MTALTIAQFDRIPSIGALLGTQGHKEVLDQINSELGSSSFFGSDDPFASQHEFFIKRVVEPIQLVAQQFKAQFKELVHPQEANVFRPIISLVDLERGIPECMWEAVAMHPTVRKLGKQHRVDLFGIDESSLPEENPYERLMNNGKVTLDAESLRENDGKYEVEFTHCTTDPVLTDDELYDLADTYDFLSLFYQGLDDMYAKMDKLHVLKEKSYMTEGTQIQDLDVTSFPNKKG